MATLPSGTYYIGDPCYAIPDDEWDAYLEAKYAQLGDDTDGGIFEFKGKKVYWHSTAFGDGEFDGFLVDSGTLGLIPIELIGMKEKAEIEANGLGQIEHFDDPEVDYVDGIFELGDYSINTNGENEDLDDEDDEAQIICIASP